MGREESVNGEVPGLWLLGFGLGTPAQIISFRRQADKSYAPGQAEYFQTLAKAQSPKAKGLIIDKNLCLAGVAGLLQVLHNLARRGDL